MQVHSHAELAHLLLADVRRTNQLYFEIQRDSQIRNLEEATNARTAVEAMLHKHFVLHTCNDVVKEFIQSTYYSVFKKSDDDAEDVIALVCRREAQEAEAAYRPFQLSRVRYIRKNKNRLLCSCSSTTVHGRPCRHLIAFNSGVIDRSDFADFHTKKYYVEPHASTEYIGVGDHSKDLTQLPPLPPHLHFLNDAPHDADTADYGDNACNVPAAKIRKARGYHSCAEEFKRILVKWGNVSRVLQRFEEIVREYDDSLGEVETYRCGRASSKPTPQASRK
jgi:hypothetical protein